MKLSVCKIIFQILPVLLFAVQESNAQSSRKLIHEGNKKYEEKKYGEAEIDYRKSINTKENPFIGNYNLGNTYYQQGKFNEAKQQFESAAAEKSANKEQLSKAYHNLGNSLLKAEKYEESLQAYKQALKLNPKDNDTRYNLAYAQSKLQQQQQQQQQQNKDNKDQNNKDQQQNKDDQNKQDKKDQQKDKEQQQQQDQASDKKEKNEQQAKKDKISKEDAEKILQALNNDEKKTQKKLNVKQPVRVMIEKEW